MSKLDNIKTHPAVQEYLKELCRNAGSSTSEKKAKAARKNGLSPCKPGKFRGRPPKCSAEEIPSEILRMIKEAEIKRLRK